MSNFDSDEEQDKNVSGAGVTEAGKPSPLLSCSHISMSFTASALYYQYVNWAGQVCCHLLLLHLQPRICVTRFVVQNGLRWSSPAERLGSVLKINTRVE